MSMKATKMRSPKIGKHSRTSAVDPCEILEEFGRLVKSYAECSVATPPTPPKPSGSRRIDRIASDVFYLAMRAFVAESQAASLLATDGREWSPAPEANPIDSGTTDEGVKPLRKNLRVEIPQNHISSLLVPVMSPLSAADEVKELPSAVRSIRDSLDACTSEIRQLKFRLGQKEGVHSHPQVEEPKSPVVVELETELDQAKSTLQDIRLRGQSLQSRNDVLARQTERIRNACSLLLEGHFDDASWKSVFDVETSSLLQSHPLSRLRVGLAHFISQLTSALKTFRQHGAWTNVSGGGLGSKFQDVCEILNDIMAHAKVRYVRPSKSLARAQSALPALKDTQTTRPPLRPKPSGLRGPPKSSSPRDESEQEL